MRKIFAFCLAFAAFISCIGTAGAAETEAVQEIVLASQESGGSYIHSATLNGEAVPEYDYTWHADPSQAHEDVKNSPAEYFTGTKPSGQDAVYIAHDIVYYPELEESKFQQVRYDGETEWVYPYEAEGYTEYLFSTLPVLRTGFPSHMMHSQEEAYQNAVLHITQPGTYALSGQWHGQIWIDLGAEDDVYADPEKKVTLILNGVDITCTVAPGVVFASVYESDNGWEEADSYSQNVDTADAGANVILADGSVNNVSGTNIFRILKTKFKDEDSREEHPAQKKAWKIDGAFYSFQSMNITGQAQGTGVLNITSGFEGLNTEHHLTLNGGNVYIYSQDDGINVNEDNVSVLTVNGGNLHICAGLGSEGDGIDSNGYLVINGGTVITSANPASDAGLDSDRGSFVNGGTVVALGAAMSWAESDDTSDSDQAVLNFRFEGSQSADEAIILTDKEGNVVFAYDPDKDEVTGENQRTYRGAIVSAPGLEIGGEYHIYIGGDVAGTDVSGVYAIDTVTGFSGAQQQVYSGDQIGGMRGPGFGGPGFGGRGDRMEPEKPDGNGRQKPDRGNPGERPDFDKFPEGKGEPPEGEGFERGWQGDPGGENRDIPAGGTCMNEAVFVMKEQVNAFSGVSDLRHELVPAADGDGSVCSICGVTSSEKVLAPSTVTVDAADGEAQVLWFVLGGAGLLAMAGLGLSYKKNKEW